MPRHLHVLVDISLTMGGRAMVGSACKAVRVSAHDLSSQDKAEVDVGAGEW